MISEAIRSLVRRENLTRDEMQAVFADLVSGTVTDVQKAAFLVALRMKGETPEEIAAVRKSYTGRAIKDALK